MPPIQGIAMGEYGAPKEHPGEPFYPAGLDRVKPDRGCRYSPSCLSCPFPKCMQEIPKGDRYRAAATARRLGQAKLFFDLLASGIGSQEAAETVASEKGVTARTVFRSVADLRQEATRLLEAA